MAGKIERRRELEVIFYIHIYFVVRNRGVSGTWFHLCTKLGEINFGLALQSGHYFRTE